MTKQITNPCEYRTYCKAYSSDDSLCTNADCERSGVCIAYRDIMEKSINSRHYQRPLRDSFLIKILRGFRK